MGAIKGETMMVKVRAIIAKHLAVLAALRGIRSDFSPRRKEPQSAPNGIWAG